MTLLNLVNHLWQSTAVALAVLVLVLVFRGIPARTRRALCWLALAKFAVPLTLISPFQLPLGPLGRWLAPAQTTVISAAAPVQVPEVSVAPVETPRAIAKPSRPLSPNEWLILIWAAGAIGVTGLWSLRTTAFRRRILSNAIPLSGTLERQLRAAATKLGLAEAPRGIAVTDDYAPAVVGLFSPVVILPTGLEHDLAPAEIESVLLHELVHVQRRDSLLATLQALAVSVLWFNPVAWLIARQLQIESEKSCDERVLEVTGDSNAYAGGILKCVHRSLGISQPLLSVANPPVTQRIKAILDYGHRPDRPAMRRLVIGAALVLVSIGGLAGTFAANAPTQPAATPVVQNQPAPAPTPTIPGWDGTTVFRGPITSVMVPPAPAPVPEAPVAPVAPAAPPAHPLPDTLTVDFPDTDIRTIIQSVAQLFDLNVAIPEGLTGKTSIKLRGVTWRQIFSTVLEPIGYTFEVQGDVVRIGLAAPAGAAPATSAPTLTTSVYAHKGASDLINVDFPNQDIRTIVANVADLYDLNVVIPDTISGKTSIKLFNASWAQIFDAVLKPAGYTYMVQGNIIKIVPAVPPAPAPIAYSSLPAPRDATEGIAVVPLGQPVQLAGLGEIFDPSKLDRIPQAQIQGKPGFPFEMRRQGIAGSVVVEFIVDSNGNVPSAWATRSTQKEFENDAIAAVQHWKFRPGMKSGKAVATHMSVEIVFNLNDLK